MFAWSTDSTQRTAKAAQTRQHRPDSTVKAAQSTQWMLVDVLTPNSNIMRVYCRPSSRRETANDQYEQGLEFLDLPVSSAPWRWISQRYHWCLEFHALPVIFPAVCPLWVGVFTTMMPAHFNCWCLASSWMVKCLVFHLDMYGHNTLHDFKNMLKYAATVKHSFSNSTCSAECLCESTIITISIIFQYWVKILVKTRVFSVKVLHILLLSSF